MKGNIAWLDAKYGKLTVLGQHTENGRTVADVRCDCGMRKSVLGSSLISGNTRSCGAPLCNGSRKKFRRDASFVPRRSKHWDEESSQQVWTMYNDGQSYTQIAEELGLLRSRVVTHIRVIGRCGGLDAYLELLNSRGDES